jgi:superfamily I DNA/RNA helicase
MNTTIIWSDEQNLIINFGRNGVGHLVVRARAGTGKTTTIIQMVLQMRGRVLLVAFNKSIAEELQARIKGNPNALAKTLHALGLACIFSSGWGKILGQKISINADRGRDIAHDILKTKDNSKLKPVAYAVAKLASIGKGAAPFATAEQLADLADCYGISIECDDDAIRAQYDSQLGQLARRAMDRALVEDGSIDFDDMVFVPVVKKLARAQYDAVVVDEAQDMNASQLLLARAVCVPTGRIIVVGDDRQAIYGFRGADSNSIDRLKKELNAKELGLKITRRCPKQVVAVAQGLVPDFVAAPDAPEGEVITLDGSKLVATAGAGDFILSRTNAPLVQVCFALLRSKKRAKIQGRDIGKTLISIIDQLKARDIADFKQKLDIWALKERSKAEGKKESVAEAIIARVNDQQDMLSMIADESGSVAEIQRTINDLFDDADPSKAPFIVCSSVHKAKGLEAKRVFMIQNTFYKGKDAQEEENIEYVAITRAKQTLFVVPALPAEWKREK